MRYIQCNENHHLLVIIMSAFYYGCRCHSRRDWQGDKDLRHEEADSYCITSKVVISVIFSDIKGCFRISTFNDNIMNLIRIKTKAEPLQVGRMSGWLEVQTQLSLPAAAAMAVLPVHPVYHPVYNSADCLTTSIMCTCWSVTSVDKNGKPQQTCYYDQVTWIRSFDQPPSLPMLSILSFDQWQFKLIYLYITWNAVWRQSKNSDANDKLLASCLRPFLIRNLFRFVIWLSLPLPSKATPSL